MATPAGGDHSRYTIERFILMGFFGLFPLFFLPFTQDFYDFHKWLFLLVVALSLALIWAVRAVQTNTIKLTLSPQTTAYSLLSLASLVSLIIASPNKVEALMSPLGLPTYLALTLLFLFSGHILDKHLRFTLKWLLFGSLGIAGIAAIYQFVGFGTLMFPGVRYLGDPLWTPVGSSIGFTAMALLVLPLLFDEARGAFKHRHNSVLAACIVLGITLSAGLILTLIHLVPRYTQLTLLPNDGWPITLEVLKNPVQAIAGVGIENFMAAFTAGRPLRLNNSLMWNARFGSNATVLFHFTATLGLLGAVGVGFLLRCFWQQKKSEVRDIGELIVNLLAIAGILLLPPIFSLFMFLACILFLRDNPNYTVIHWRLHKSLSWIPILLTILATGIVFVSGYGLFRLYRGERAFYLSMRARERNDGKETYDRQIQAIRLNGYPSRYHYQLSQTSLAIANFIASNPSGSATDSGQKALTPEDQQMITNLIQQAINEGKLAIKRSPQDVFLWENLAQIYDGIATMTPDAKKWAISAYQQAIVLDPTNPSLRIALGGKFLQEGNWDGAVQQFTVAVNLKPDYANAHYNLAYAYQQKKNYLQAAYALKKTLTLVPSGSEDFIKTDKLLAEIKSFLTPQEAKDFDASEN